MVHTIAHEQKPLVKNYRYQSSIKSVAENHVVIKISYHKQVRTPIKISKSFPHIISGAKLAQIGNSFIHVYVLFLVNGILVRHSFSSN